MRGKIVESFAGVAAHSFLLPGTFLRRCRGASDDRAAACPRAFADAGGMRAGRRYRPGRSIMLQPLSVSGQIGVNLALGVARLTLRPR
jgi:hypothetical protein